MASIKPQTQLFPSIYNPESLKPYNTASSHFKDQKEPFPGKKLSAMKDSSKKSKDKPKHHGREVYGKKKKQEYTKENGKRPFSEGKNPYDAVQKKLKIDNDKWSLVNPCNPPTQPLKIHEENLQTKIEDSVTDISEAQTGVEESRVEDKIKRMKEHSRHFKTMRISYEDNQKNLLFNLDFLNSATKQIQTMTMTRNQMLEYDPLLMVAFYETHLQFPQEPEFKIETMKRL